MRSRFDHSRLRGVDPIAGSELVELLFGEAAELLRAAGQPAWADRLSTKIIGRNVLKGRWTFQVVEEYDATYRDAVRGFERDAREALADGVRHIYESEMKDERRSQGRRHHEARPPQGS